MKKVEDLGIQYLEIYSGQTLSIDMPDVKIGHNLSGDHIKIVKRNLMMHGITPVSYGVVNFQNDEESMRKVFDFAKNMGIATIMTEPEYDDYSLIEKMAQEYKINVAIHNHPIPSKFALPKTVLEHIHGSNERIGVCADTGHWMRSGVDPLDALRLLDGRILNVHLKDLNEFGSKDAYDVPFGFGKGKIHDILAELTMQNYRGYLAIEHENKDEVDNPSPSVKKGIEYIKNITSFAGYEEILGWSNGRYNKHGWNHYGPGYFEIDEKTGILKSQGGMGLFWYSANTFKDFILELDFKCEEKFTNSGIFLRVPGIPNSNEYIFHSFEIQIDDAGEGIHITGAVYDAKPPTGDTSKPTGEWNHFKITCKGNNYKVELNDTMVVDWETEPHGKIRDFADEGYIGLQNHDSRAPVYFRNIFVKELK